MQTFDFLLAEQGTPVLAGLKTANLLSLETAAYPELPALLAQYDRAFSPKGIRFEMLCACRCRSLVLVYRPDRLLSDLGQPEARKLLQACGYPLEGGLSELINHLRSRISKSCEFPHEIGLFLGYPPLDVCGFIEKHGRDSKLTGYWKVYGDADAARRTFARFDRCREAARTRIAQGATMFELFSVA